jgi:hypothetical protein
VAGHVPAALHAPVALSVQNAFMSGLHTGCLVAAGVCAVGAIGALALPGSPLRVSTAAAPQRIDATSQLADATNW